MWICAKTDNILYFCIKFLLRGCLKTNVKAGVHSPEVDFGMN